MLIDFEARQVAFTDGGQHYPRGSEEKRRGRDTGGDGILQTGVIHTQVEDDQAGSRGDKAGDAKVVDEPLCPAFVLHKIVSVGNEGCIKKPP